MNLTDKIDAALAIALEKICTNPVFYVSEMDVHFNAMQELVKIPELEKAYPTSCSIGVNQKGEPSKTTYNTTKIHKEYGHSNLLKARSDIVILNESRISMIDDPIDLKSNGDWLPPDYIIEFGTEKSAKSKESFQKHLNNDIKKAKNGEKKGYVIHIQRNLCRSHRGRFRRNRAKYKDYSDVVNEAYKKLSSKTRLAIMIVDIGNENRRISKEGKVKLHFKGEGFKGINIKELKDTLVRVFR